MKSIFKYMNKKIQSPKKIQSLPSKNINLPSTSMLENLPLEIFCEIWKKIGFIPISYLADIVHTSKKIASNVYYCTNKIWIDKKINLNFLKNFKKIDIIATVENNIDNVRKYVPKTTKIIEYVKDIIICIQSDILTDDPDQFDEPDMWMDHADALENLAHDIIIKYFPSALESYQNCSANSHIAYIIPNKNIPADYKHRLQKMKIELDKIPNELEHPDYLTITIKTPIQ